MRLTGLACAAAFFAVACGGDRDVERQGAGSDIGVASRDAERTVEVADRDASVGAIAPEAVAARTTDQLGDDSVSGTPMAVPMHRMQAAPQSRTSVESRLMHDGALMSDTFGIINDGQAWANAVRAFENDGLTDPEARDLHQLFGDWLSTSLGRHGLEISGFGCGRSLCAATIPVVAPDAAARYAAWYETDANQPPMPLPVFAQTAFTWPSGASEMRILFSTDPDVTGVNAP